MLLHRKKRCIEMVKGSIESKRMVGSISTKKGCRNGENKARNTATAVTCRWGGAVIENVIRASEQRQWAEKAH